MLPLDGLRSLAARLSSVDFTASGRADNGDELLVADDEIDRIDGPKYLPPG